MWFNFFENVTKNITLFFWSTFFCPKIWSWIFCTHFLINFFSRLNFWSFFFNPIKRLSDDFFDHIYPWLAQCLNETPKCAHRTPANADNIAKKVTFSWILRPLKPDCALALETLAFLKMAKIVSPPYLVTHFLVTKNNEFLT